MNVEDLITADFSPASWFEPEKWVLGVLCLEDGDKHPTLYVRTVDESTPRSDKHGEYVTARWIHTSARDCELLAVWTEYAPVGYRSVPCPSFGGLHYREETPASNRMSVGWRLFVDRHIQEKGMP